MADRRANGPGRAETGYRLLRERILTCELAPGERQTADEHGLGLAAVREAPTRLAQDQPASL